MNKYCTVKLVNLPSPDTAKNRTQLRDFNSSYLHPTNNLNKGVKRKLKTGNVSSKSDSCKFIEKDAQTVNYISENRTRSSRVPVSKNIQPKEHSNQIVDMGFEQTDSLVSLKHCSKNRNRSETVEKNETKTGKRKYSPEGNKDVLPLLKKPFNVPNVMSNTSNVTKNTKIEDINKKATEKKEGNQEKRNRRKKKKGSKTLWENKLTGAKRVSKRLTNLKIKNKNLDKFQSCINTDNAILKNKKIDSPVSSVDKKIRKMRISHDNLTKNLSSNVVRKPIYNRSSQQNLPGQNKKSYRKIPSNRKISTSYRVKVKPSSSTVSNKSYTRKPVNIFIEYSESEHESTNSTSSDEDEINISRLIKESVTSVNEDIQKIDAENNQDLEGNSSEIELLDNHDDTTDIQGQVNEPQSVEVVEKSKDDTLNTIVYDVEEECINSSEVIIVDLESGKSMLYEHAENCQLTDASIKSDSQTNEEKEQVFEEFCHGTSNKSNKEDSDVSTTSSKEKADSLVNNQSQTENSVVTNVINIESYNTETENGQGQQGKTKNAEVIMDKSNASGDFVK